MKKEHFILPLILVTSFLLRLPSLFEPNWYGDEGIYQVIGQVVHQGGLLYRDAWDNKPPLLYLIYAIFDGNQVLVRLLSLLVMLATIVGFFFLGKKLFKEEKTVYVSTSVFALLFASPLLEGNIANAENFMYLPIIAGLYLVVKHHKDEKSLLYIFFAGLLLGIAFLIKIVAIFDLGALLIFLFVTLISHHAKQWLTKSFLLSFGFALPIILTIVFFFFQGALSDFVTATFAQNVTYVGAGNRLFFGQGLLLIKLLLLAVFSFLIFFWRNRLSWEHVFIYLWVALSLFNAFFGGRPWIHYLLTILPALCLFAGMIVENQKSRFINIVLFLGILLLLSKSFWIYGKIFRYYPNFMAYASGAKDEKAYRDFFDWFVNRDYEIAYHIRQHSKENDRLFIWGDNAQIYAIADRLPPGRYTVSYHVTFYPNALLETKAAIEQNKPAFIVAIRDDFPMVLLDNSYVFEREIQGAKIFKRT